MNPRVIARLQGLYYVVTGLLPLADMERFEAITGPKRDRWLVRSTGLLVATVGAVLALRPSRLLGTAFAAALATADVRHAWPASRSRSYLLDAAIEGLAVLAWWWRRPSDMP